VSVGPRAMPVEVACLLGGPALAVVTERFHAMAPCIYCSSVGGLLDPCDDVHVSSVYLSSLLPVEERGSVFLQRYA